MEKIIFFANKVEEFLSISSYWGSGSGSGEGLGSGSGSGEGSGLGSGWGSGSGEGSGSGLGWGLGSGSGWGSGWGLGSGSGWGEGSGEGSGSGEGWGSGSGWGSGKDISFYNDNKVYYIDGIPTIIEKVKGNLAKGFVINEDLTTEPCYIVKAANCFAHGATVEEARESLKNKLFEDMDEEDRISAFFEEFNLKDKYSAKAFYNWHNRLTGSCEFGRRNFIKNHGINLETDCFTVKEFCELCKNDYGGVIIRKILERLEK